VFNVTAWFAARGFKITKSKVLGLAHEASTVPIRTQNQPIQPIQQTPGLSNTNISMSNKTQEAIAQSANLFITAVAAAAATTVHPSSSSPSMAPESGRLRKRQRVGLFVILFFCDVLLTYLTRWSKPMMVRLRLLLHLEKHDASQIPA
jgi:hypothetical protein